MSTPKKKPEPKDNGPELAFSIFRDIKTCKLEHCEKDQCKEEKCWRDQIVSGLKDQYGIEAKTTDLNVWRKLRKWDNRIKRNNARDDNDGQDGRSYEQRMFDSLLKRKEAYERFFDSQADNVVDNNAQWAYNDIINKLMSLLGSMHAAELEDMTPEEAKQKLSELFNSAYGLGPCR